MLECQKAYVIIDPDHDDDNNSCGAEVEVARIVNTNYSKESHSISFELNDYENSILSQRVIFGKHCDDFYVVNSTWGLGMILSNPWSISETLSELLYADYCDFDCDDNSSLNKLCIFANAITFIAKEFFADCEPEFPF